MSNDPMYAITMAAANLKGLAPEQFEALVSAFQMLEDKLLTELLAAPPVGIFNAQGKADLAKELKGRLQKCTEQRNKYTHRV